LYQPDIEVLQALQDGTLLLRTSQDPVTLY